MVQLKTLKKGDYFKRKPDSKTVFVRGQYLRLDKKYSIYPFDDVSNEYLQKGETLVYVDFEF